MKGKQSGRAPLYEFRLRFGMGGIARGMLVHDLAGRDLACWCLLDMPCQADILLKMANE